MASPIARRSLLVQLVLALLTLQLSLATNDTKVEWQFKHINRILLKKVKSYDMMRCIEVIEDTIKKLEQRDDPGSWEKLEDLRLFASLGELRFLRTCNLKGYKIMKANEAKVGGRELLANVDWSHMKANEQVMVHWAKMHAELCQDTYKAMFANKYSQLPKDVVYRVETVAKVVVESWIGINYDEIGQGDREAKIRYNDAALSAIGRVATLDIAEKIRLLLINFIGGEEFPEYKCLKKKEKQTRMQKLVKKIKSKPKRCKLEEVVDTFLLEPCRTYIKEMKDPLLAVEYDFRLSKRLLLTSDLERIKMHFHTVVYGVCSLIVDREGKQLLSKLSLIVKQREPDDGKTKFHISYKFSKIP